MLRVRNCRPAAPASEELRTFCGGVRRGEVPSCGTVSGDVAYLERSPEAAAHREELYRPSFALFLVETHGMTGGYPLQRRAERKACSMSPSAATMHRSSEGKCGYKQTLDEVFVSEGYDCLIIGLPNLPGIGWNSCNLLRWLACC